MFENFEVFEVYFENFWKFYFWKIILKILKNTLKFQLNNSLAISAVLGKTGAGLIAINFGDFFESYYLCRCGRGHSE